MAKKTVTVCHCPELIPKSGIRKFAEIGAKAYIAYNEALSFKPATVPGSVLITTEVRDGFYAKEINFEISDVTEETAALLSRLRWENMIVRYKDEKGNERVAGSPSFPLSLTYRDREGVFEVTLSGTSLAPDSFFHLS